MTSVKSDTPDMTEALGDQESCADKLAGMWKAADQLPGYPVKTDDVVFLLRTGGGYDVSAELLEGWIRSGMVPDVATPCGQFAWNAQNILCAATHSDIWRRFIPMDPRHIYKLTAIELTEAVANAAGSTAFTDLETFDVNAFIEVLQRCEITEMRQTFAVALKTKLRRLGVLDK